jgi:hypothetical protein
LLWRSDPGRGKPVAEGRLRGRLEGVMSRTRTASNVVLVTLVVAAGAAALGATKTSVSLAGRDDAIPKLGLPGIAVRVDAPGPDARAFVADELVREFASQVHTRPLAAGEPEDYDLIVDVGTARPEGSATIVPFTAVLTSPRGERLWRVEGRSEVQDGPLDGSVFVGIARNVVSALVHDGWVAPRQDPDDPPPQAPTIRTENGH